MRFCSVMMVGLGLSILPTSAEAAWSKAESAHFVVYSEMEGADLRAYANQLERFDSAARTLLKMKDPPVGDGNRVHIYMVKNVAAVRELYGKRDPAPSGFYIPRYTGPVAFVPREVKAGAFVFDEDNVFFHEYAHHLMFQQFSRPFPNWYVEGFAELMSTAKFDKDGSVTIGIAPMARMPGVMRDDGLTTEQMVGVQPAKLSPDERRSLYSKGWLLTHYLTFERARQGQLSRYFDELARGVAPAAAARSVFGDLKQLDKELADYRTRRSMLSLKVDPSVLKVAPVTVTVLSDAESRAMPAITRLKRGGPASQSGAALASLRAIAKEAPTSAFLQTALAESEYYAGNADASLAAANAAISIAPSEEQALVMRGKALTRMAQKDGDRVKLDQARDALIAANKLDTEDPEPLYDYFRTFLVERRQPTANAISALHYASTLAPGIPSLRLASARAWMIADRPLEAKQALLPIAYDPHGGALSTTARSAIERLDAKDSKGALTALDAGLRNNSGRERDDKD
nr:hypothetical protein [uncultured Sphingomonas sp.]